MNNCKACNKRINTTVERKVKIEDGTYILVEEDLCPNCRDQAFYLSESVYSSMVGELSSYDHDTHVSLGNGGYITRAKRGCE